MNFHLKETVLITGATGGIGYELAREFARHGHDLVLVAPVEQELLTATNRLRTEFGVSVKPLPADLRREGAADDVFAEIMALGIPIGILVNNAGEGRRGKFWDIPLEDDISLIRLNIEAGIRLTKRFLPALLAESRGRILNTALVAGFEPGPLLSVYEATKAFVLSWSESLAAELEGTGVSLTVLCPEPAETDSFAKAGMIDPLAFPDNKATPPQEVAATAYQALMNGERVVVPAEINKVLVGERAAGDGCSNL